MAQRGMRPYRPGDERAIVGLAGVVYPRLSLDLAEWNWRYRDNPAGRAIIELAEDGDRMAAHYALSPVVLRADGVDELAHLSLLTMTHPDYRGRGLFPQLAERTYQRAHLSGSRMVWGFPNRSSHRCFVRGLKWKDIYEIPMLRLALDGYSTFSPSPNVAVVSEFDERFDRLWQRVGDRYRYVVRRDAEYLQWRYVQNPTGHYRILVYTGAGSDILGYAVFKRYRNEYQIVDLLAQNVHVGSSLVRSIVLWAADGAIPPDALSLWLNVTDPLHRALEKMGFCNEGPVTYLGARALSSPGERPDYYDWYVTMGDSDVF